MNSRKLRQPGVSLSILVMLLLSTKHVYGSCENVLELNNKFNIFSKSSIIFKRFDLTNISLRLFMGIFELERTTGTPNDKKYKILVICTTQIPYKVRSSKLFDENYFAIYEKLDKVSCHIFTIDHSLVEQNTPSSNNFSFTYSTSNKINLEEELFDFQISDNINEMLDVESELKSVEHSSDGTYFDLFYKSLFIDKTTLTLRRTDPYINLQIGVYIFFNEELIDGTYDAKKELNLLTKQEIRNNIGICSDDVRCDRNECHNTTKVITCILFPKLAKIHEDLLKNGYSEFNDVMQRNVFGLLHEEIVTKKASPKLYRQIFITLEILAFTLIFAVIGFMLVLRNQYNVKKKDKIIHKQKKINVTSEQKEKLDGLNEKDNKAIKMLRTESLRNKLQLNLLYQDIEACKLQIEMVNNKIDVLKGRKRTKFICK
eukprot:GAHX01000529.1.p1 GENE.GAHX01000529.1~~GAHX01000529.1.p1  ORF type:complete len:429 (-),score=82.65 GAHX01000529.1:23-1309(-)